MRKSLALLVVLALLGWWGRRACRRDLVSPRVRAARIIGVEVTETDVEVWREEFLDAFWDPPLPRWVDRLWESQLAEMHGRADARVTALLRRQLGRRFVSRAEKEAFLRSRLERLREELLAEPERDR